VAGKPVLEHVFDVLSTAPDPENQELIFITGYLGDQIETFMKEKHPHVKATFIEQTERRGQSHAIALAREYISGPTLIVFVDTVIGTDLSFLKDEKAGSVLWVREVEDPRRFGVVELGDNQRVVNLIEKPEDMSLNLAIVGFYFFAQGEELIDAIDEQMVRDLRVKGEFFIADAMRIMLERGLEMRIEPVDIWLDAGVPQAVLDTNRFLLGNGCDNTSQIKYGSDVTIVPPVYIHPSAEIEESTIGPHVSVGPACHIKDSHIQDSILEYSVTVKNSLLSASIIGERTLVDSFSGSVNIGDDTEVRGMAP
jgi:glucose-1-phosphate thymidylyltransferase